MFWCEIKYFCFDVKQILLFAIVGIAVHKYEDYLDPEEIFKAQTEHKISFRGHNPTELSGYLGQLWIIMCRQCPNTTWHGFIIIWPQIYIWIGHFIRWQSQWWRCGFYWPSPENKVEILPANFFHKIRCRPGIKDQHIICVHEYESLASPLAL